MAILTCQREVERYGRPVAGYSLHPDAAMVLPDDAVGRGKVKIFAVAGLAREHLLT